MSGLEQAIRHALERADRANPDIRSRIYQSARNALDAGLKKQAVTDANVFERQRQRLEATIAEIEDEELARLRSIAAFERVALEREPEPENEPEPVAEAAPAVAPVQPVATAPAVAPPVASPVEAPAVETEPVVDGSAPERTAEPTGRVEPAIMVSAPETRTIVVEAPAHAARPDDEGSLDDLVAFRDDRSEARATADIAAPEARVRQKAKKGKARKVTATDLITETPKRRRSRGASVFASLFVYLFLLGIIGGAGWWVYTTGMVSALMKGDGDFDLVPAALKDDSVQIIPAKELDTLRGFSGEWTDIYKPGSSSDPVTARLKAEVGQSRDSDGLATTIASGAPDQDGDVLVPVPASILQDLAGKTSTLAITVKSDSDKPAHIYIQCEFTTLGDCGRHRYTVTNERADELIRVNFDGKLGPSEPGFIVINSDVTGEGGRIRLYGIRVLEGS